MESNSYSKQILESLELFRRDDLFCDTVIVIGEQQLKAHGVVLAASSSVFRAALESNAEPGLHFLNLSGYEFEALEAAVHFIYTGKLNVGVKYASSEKFSELLTSLEDLGLSIDQFQTYETVFSDEAEELSNKSLHIKVEDYKDDKETESKALLVEDQSSSTNKQLNSCPGQRVIKKENVHYSSSQSGTSSTSQGQGQCLEDIKALARCPDNDSSVLNEVTNGWVLHSENGVHFVEIPADILAEVQTGIHKQDDLVKWDRVSENGPVNTSNRVNCEKSFSQVKNRRSRNARVSGNSVVSQNVSNEVHSKDLRELPDAEVMPEILPDVMVKKKKRQNLVCPTCGKTFGKIDHFTLHLRVHSGEKPYACDICHKKFSFVNNLQRHMRSHTGDKRYLCHLCGSAFIQKTTLEDHISVHTKEKKHPCKLCGKFFKSASCLRAHSKRHKLGSVRDRHRYLDLSDLADGMKHAESIVTDTGVIRFVCKICRKDYASKNSLAIHVQHHSSTRPFACDLCKKSFWQRAHLEIHERTHSGERPFTCNTCGKSFTYSGGLSTHIRLHTGEKPYKCDICSSAYTQQAHLKSHLRTHTGEKPFECKACGKKYRNKVDLRFHLKRNDACNKMS